MLTVVAAVLIGGTAYTGGEGGLLGTVIGVLFLGIVQNGLTLSSVSSFWQGTVSGLILIVAVGLGVLREHGWSLRRRRAAGAAQDDESDERGVATRQLAFTTTVGGSFGRARHSTPARRGSRGSDCTPRRRRRRWRIARPLAPARSTFTPATERHQMKTKLLPSSGRSKAVRLTVPLALRLAAVAAFAGASLAAKPKIVIGSAHPILAGQPDQQALLLGQRKVAKLLGWPVSPLDAQLSTDKQIAAIDTFTTKKVQGITTFSLDPKGAEPAFKRAKSAGIPVVGFNSAAPSVTTVIKQNIFWTCKPGEDAAKFIASQKPGARCSSWAALRCRC